MFPAVTVRQNYSRSPSCFFSVMSLNKQKMPEGNCTGTVSAALPEAQLGKVSTFYEVTVAINSAASAERKNACKPRFQ